MFCVSNLKITFDLGKLQLTSYLILEEINFRNDLYIINDLYIKNNRTFEKTIM
jgi:hypothetical protein